MAIISISSLDAPSFAEYVTHGTTTSVTTPVRSGLRAVFLHPAAFTQASLDTFSTLGANPPNFTHFGFRVDSLPTVDRVICGVTAIGGITARLTSTGAISIYLNTVLIGTSSVTLTLTTWYWIGVRQVTGVGVAFLQIDGVDAVTGTATVSATSDSVGFGGLENSAVQAYVDDIIFDSAVFLQPSKVVLLLPISDNARSALWTGALGGTTNLFDAVNNIVPLGTSSASATNLTQIEHTGGSAVTTDAYDANMTTYSTAGINAADTVLAIDYLIICGEDIATGTKLLNFSLVSNPASASGLANFDVNPASGAVAGFPSNWIVKRNTLVLSPSVTVGTSPVMRVVRPETVTRVADVCFMGMTVAWTPAAAAGVPYVSPYLQLFPQ